MVVEGTLYPLLTRLKNDGLLTYRWVESTGGPPRKYFTLTDEGGKFLSEMVAAYRSQNQSVDKIIQAIFPSQNI
jgi:PadR family transcriptional regulator PadR